VALNGADFLEVEESEGGNAVDEPITVVLSQLVSTLESKSRLTTIDLLPRDRIF